jgi:imidazole glycerol-phosphate synthase subunit HisH
MTDEIVIVDYGMGNLHSVQKRIHKVGGKSIISSDPDIIANASKIVLPGVGHFGKAMKNLKDKNIFQALNQAVLERKVPILGICLGMQIMAKHSEEGDAEGLGWIDATIKRFSIEDKLRYKVPHMGWNTVTINKESLLFSNTQNNPEFYFVHSFYLASNDKSINLNETNYEQDFVSAIQLDNIFGVQYHPEKSHDSGNSLFKNFINL